MNQRAMIRLAQLVALFGAGYLGYTYVIRPLLDAAGGMKKFIEDAGQAVKDVVTGDIFTRMTPAEFLKINWQDGVKMPDGSVMSIVKNTVNAQMIFPKMGNLYVLGRNKDGDVSAQRAPAGTRYDYPDFYAVQRAEGGVTVTNK